MGRPFKDERPIGPFVDPDFDFVHTVSRFDEIEVQRQSEDSEFNYDVAGIMNPGGEKEYVGLHVETQALMVNDSTFALSGEGSKAIFTGGEEGEVSIQERGPNLVIIRVE